MNLKVHDYSQSAWLFNLVLTERAVYTSIEQQA